MDRILIPRKALMGTNSLHHFKEFAREHLPQDLSNVMETDREWRDFRDNFRSHADSSRGVTRKSFENMLRDLKSKSGDSFSYKEARQIEKSIRSSVEGGKVGDKGEDYFPDRL